MLTSSRSLAISCLLLALALSLPAVPLCAQTNVAPGAAPVQQGTGMPKVPAVPDALPRERWALAACVVFLVTAGVLPGKLVAWRAASAERLIQAFGSEDHSKH